MSVNRQGESALQQIAGNVVPDAALSTTSTNSVQNKVVTEAINAINSDLDAHISYATCATAANTITKVATSDTGDVQLKAGAKVKVKFTNANTVSNNDTKLNVDDTGGKVIYAYGTTRPNIWWKAGDVVEFIYDGTYWIMLPSQGQIYDINTELSQLNSDLSDLDTVEDISSKITSTTGTLSVTYAYRYGRMCVVTLSFTATSAITAWSLDKPLFKIASSIAPKNGKYHALVNVYPSGTNTPTGIYGWINATNCVSSVSMTSGQACRLTGCWIID